VKVLANEHVLVGKVKCCRDRDGDIWLSVETSYSDGEQLRFPPDCSESGAHRWRIKQTLEAKLVKNGPR
jgi:hypothetical protein